MEAIQVRLRKLDITDAEALTYLANNEKISANLRDQFPHPYEERDAVRFINGTLKEDPEQTFAIICEGQLCGVIGLVVQSDIYRRSAELGFWLGEPFWGRGTATEAVRLITEHAFAVLGLERLYAGVFEYNKASMRVLEKNGFKKEGVLRRAVFKNGRFWDEHRYARLRGDQMP